MTTALEERLWGQFEPVVEDERREFYDPAQPRDQRGRWSPAGGGGKVAEWGQEDDPENTLRSAAAQRFFTEEPSVVAWEKSLTDDEKDALSNYGGFGYRRINEYMTGKREPEEDSRWEAQTKTDIALMKGTAERFRMPETHIFYRGMSAPEGLAAGDSFHAKAFSSTTAVKAMGVEYAKHPFGMSQGVKADHLVKITVPKGVHAIPQGAVTPWKSEQELILPPGRFRVTKVTRGIDAGSDIHNGKLVHHTITEVEAVYAND